MKKELMILILCGGLITGCARQAAQEKDAIILHNETGQVSTNIIEETAVSTEAFPSQEPAAVSGNEDAFSSISEDAAKQEASTEPEEASTELNEASTELYEAESGEEVNSERVTYQDGFYYEPLSEEVKTRITGKSYPADCSIPYSDLRYVSVLYCDFNNETQTGEIICSKLIAQDLVEIFHELYNASYPIEKIRLIDEYNADDDLSCQDNNTSSFCYRTVAGSTKLSKHAQGLAIDLNPFYNPYITYPNGVPTIKLQDTAVYADREADFIAKIDYDDLAYKLFTAHGFTWGGDWNSVKDYQHFQK